MTEDRWEKKKRTAQARTCLLARLENAEADLRKAKKELFAAMDIANETEALESYTEEIEGFWEEVGELANRVDELTTKIDGA
jgi:uncharacterized protein YPO0396